MKGDNSVEDGKLSVPLAGTGSSSEWGHFTFGNSNSIRVLFTYLEERGYGHLKMNIVCIFKHYVYDS